MGAGNALAVMRQYGRAKGVTDAALTVLTFMALQTRDDDSEPVYFGGRRRIAAGCRGADVDLQSADPLPKTEANRVSICLGALVKAGALTKVRDGAARKTSRRVRDVDTSAAYRINISDDAQRWVDEQLRSSKTRPEIPGAFTQKPGQDAPGISGRVSVTRAQGSRARMAETRPETPGTQRSTAEKVEAEQESGRAQRPAAGPQHPRRPGEPPLPPKPTITVRARCTRHRDADSDQPCRGCMRAREAAEQATQAHTLTLVAWERQRDSWLRWQRDQPDCIHDCPGGNLTDPATGLPVCPDCRRTDRKAT